MELRFGPFGAPAPEGCALIPAAVPVRRGRVSLGGVAAAFGSPPMRVDVVAGLRSACWVGTPRRVASALGRLVHRSVASLDRRRRVVLDRHVRGYLAVADAEAFWVVVIALGSGGVLLVPTEDFDRRLERISLS